MRRIIIIGQYEGKKKVIQVTYWSTAVGSLFSITSNLGDSKNRIKRIWEAALLKQNVIFLSSVLNNSIRMDMGLRALDLAAESLRPEVSQPLPRTTAISDCQSTAKHSLSQPVSPAHHTLTANKTREVPPHAAATDNTLEQQDKVGITFFLINKRFGD